MSRLALPEELAGGLVAVLRARRAEQLLPVCRTLVQEGIVGLELTLTTPDALSVVAEITEALPAACIGIGTITTPEEVDDAADAGARFGVSPIASMELLSAARERALPFVGGALTPTEIHRVWSGGASAVKVFPAGSVGTGYLGQLRGPFPDLQIMPSGGVSIEDIPAWFAAGAITVSLGGDLQGRVFDDGDLDALAARSARAVRLQREHAA